MSHGLHRQKSRLDADFSDHMSDHAWAVPLFGGLDAIEAAIDFTAAAPVCAEVVQEQLRAEYERRRGLVNSQAYDDLIYGSPLLGAEERLLVDGVIDWGANDVTPRTLQREVRIAGRGRSSGGGRSKAVVGFSKAREPIDDSSHELKITPLPILEAKGFTFGELTALQSRTQAFAAAVLTAVHKQVEGGAVPELEPRFIQFGNPTRRFYVGVESEVHRTFHFHRYRGAARVALINAIHSVDRARIADYDATYNARRKTKAA